MYSLIVTAKMNDIDPQAWLADVLARIAGHPAHRLALEGHPARAREDDVPGLRGDQRATDELLPWNWRPAVTAVSHAA